MVVLLPLPNTYMTDELKESFQEYAKALKKAENAAQLIQEVANDMRVKLMSLRAEITREETVEELDPDYSVR